MAKTLNPRQQRFVQEYLIDLNATQAAIRAGYSARTANEQGARLLAKVSVAAAVQAEMDKRAKRTEITADRVLKELALLGFANAEEYFIWGPDGVTIKDSAELTPEQTAAVAEVSQTVTEQGGTIRVKLYDKRASLELIGRHLGMFKDVVEHKGDPLAIVYDRVTQPEHQPDHKANGHAGNGSAPD